MSTGSVARPFASALRSAASRGGPIASSSKLSAVALHTRTPRESAHTPQCSCWTAQTRRYSSYPTEKPYGASSSAPPRKKRTILDLQALKRKKVPITVLTAHDYPSARFIEAAAAPAPGTDGAPASHPRGIDICLVGDSLAMVACGYESTNQLSLDEMLYHCRSVARGCTTSLLLADLPFGTYAASVEDGVRAAVRLVQEGRMDAVKIEGGQEVLPLVRHLTSAGIPVMGHVGLTPQRQASLSGYRVQGKTVESATQVYRDALALQDAGAFGVVIEAVPSALAQWITDRLAIPTIGIGAGMHTSGQVLVQLDMLGVDSDLGAGGKGPRFLRKFGDVGPHAREAVRAYVDAVRGGEFPVEGQHTYPMSDETFQAFCRAMETEAKQ